MIAAARRGFAVSALALIPCVVFAAQPGDLVDNDARFGVVKTMVDPKLPPPARELTGYVDVRARFTPTGQLLEADLDADRPESVPLMDALREVLPQWRFRTPAGRDCMPVKEPVHFRVVFERGIFGATLRVMEEPREKQEPTTQEGVHAIHRQAPEYPRFVVREGKSGVTYNGADIATDGRVVNVVSAAYGAGLSEIQLRALGAASHNALLRWRFNPSPEGTRQRKACVTFFFQVAD